MTTADALLTIGQTARRANLSVATLRYYEQRGLVTSARSGGNQRRYPRPVLRRLAFITAAQRVGLSLEQVKQALDTLPADRAPSQDDWTRLAPAWRQHVADRLLELQALQDTLDNCLGCGCLSLTRCSIFNPDDEAAAEGDGSRWLREATRLRNEPFADPAVSDGGDQRHLQRPPRQSVSRTPLPGSTVPPAVIVSGRPASRT